MNDKKDVDKTNADWEAILTPEQYRICRLGHTEPRGSGDLLHNKRIGRYDCVCCGQPLFESDDKYDSKSGWPSFWQTIENANITKVLDKSHGMVRTEIRCGQCRAHLGHVFPDGPQPSGLRFCVNSAALKFVPRIIAEDELE